MKLHRLILSESPSTDSFLRPWLIAILFLATLIGPLAGNSFAAAYTFTRIATDANFAYTTPTTDGLLGLSLNNSGTVAFSTILIGGGSGVFTGNGGHNTPIALSSSPLFNALFLPPSINSAGTVAFIATLDGGGSGIFTGTGGAI